MRIAGLATVVFCAAVSLLPAVAASRSVCRPQLTASFEPPLEALANQPKVRTRAAAHCPSPARRRGQLPTCSGPHITCRGSCSNGAEFFTWQCCFGQDGFPPTCQLNCNKEIAGCIDDSSVFTN
jgi:hypothetical protein